MCTRRTDLLADGVESNDIWQHILAHIEPLHYLYVSAHRNDSGTWQRSGSIATATSNCWIVGVWYIMSGVEKGYLRVALIDKGTTAVRCRGLRHLQPHRRHAGFPREEDCFCARPATRAHRFMGITCRLARGAHAQRRKIKAFARKRFEWRDQGVTCTGRGKGLPRHGTGARKPWFPRTP